MGKGEFENRDRDEAGIGDIPDDLGRERNELNDFKPGGAAPADAVAGQRASDAAAMTGAGSPTQDYGVRSIYDSKPVNRRELAQGFTGGFITQQDSGEGGTIPAINTDLGLQAIYSVPEGYVAVIRRVRFMFDRSVPPINDDGEYNLGVKILVAGSVQLPASGIGPAALDEYFLLQTPGYVDCFLIADELQAIGVLTQNYFSAAYLAALPSLGDTYTVNLKVQFEGDLLQKTGIPAQFEIANLVGTGPPQKVLSVPTMQALKVRRRSRDPYRNVPPLKGRY